ncbi:hypothetical protein SAMN02746065_12421 [Desulfocicer vacuolatum DSM 3385]|uniref:Uncharacterized protein n=1 Tax=Desulfocicer vacuolatum DSM 3385 TaxID=1121400 RepID=A0A1W2E524_9BACT|nr:hypothetical protein SAMN02746065_12421 [Desulfocicer vacuolatum DSM 3385]
MGCNTFFVKKLKSREILERCPGQTKVKYKFCPWRFYMRYSVNLRDISRFVVGGTGSEYGLPVAVI